MNIETKSVVWGLNEYEAFGWTHTQDTHSRVGRHSQTRHILARDKDMPNYRLISALESKYFYLKSQKKEYKPIDAKWCFVAFLCFIVPGVLYVVIKNKQKKKIAEHNGGIQKQMDAVLAEVKPLI